MCEISIGSMYFDDEDIIITDPCYLEEFTGDAWDNLVDKISPRFLSNVDVIYKKNHYMIDGYKSDRILVTDTARGDWDCKVVDEFFNTIGTFCADSGLVCVFSKKYFNMKKDSHPSIYTEIKNYTGEVSFYFTEHGVCIKGFGNKPFITIINDEYYDDEE